MMWLDTCGNSTGNCGEFFGTSFIMNILYILLYFHTIAVFAVLSIQWIHYDVIVAFCFFSLMCITQVVGLYGSARMNN